MAQNCIEKIAALHATGSIQKSEVFSGGYISFQPAYVMTHDNTGAVIPKFQSIDATALANPGQVVIALDHNVQDKSEANLKKYARIETFAKTMGAHFYPAGRGIGHQIMCEEGYILPGSMVVASDSHSNMYGGLGCLGTPIVRTDAAAIWATGRTWWQIPPVVRVELTGALPEGVTGKDVIIALCGVFNTDEVLNCALEFAGEGVASLSVENRLTIANMTTEWGALVGYFPADAVTFAWLRNRMKLTAGTDSETRLNEKNLAALEASPVIADAGAYYAKTITFDLSAVVPCVAGPANVKMMKPVTAYLSEEVKINKAYLLSCVNGRTDDFVSAAKVVNGRKVAPGVELYIAAASSEVQSECEKNGSWQTLIDAGAIPLAPGCGPCIGLGIGLLQENETGISATNRNFKGRMGAASAKAYLASPAVVVSSAIHGRIFHDGSAASVLPEKKITVHPRTSAASASVQIIDGFPSVIKGTLVYCHQDNLNTDGMYPGKYTYIDDFTPAQQAEVVMENYDPEFRTIARQGDILAGGKNFGTGSSREQAATAFKYKGIQLIIAESFNETYKRNAINNGYLVVECPELISWLLGKYGRGTLTVRSSEITVDFIQSVITFEEKKFAIDPVGAAAQELVLTGGLEQWIISQLKKN